MQNKHRHLFFDYPGTALNAVLLDKYKLIQIQQQPAGGWESVLICELPELSDFFRIGSATCRQLKSDCWLLSRNCRLLPHSLSKVLRHHQIEAIIEQRERLQGGSGFVATGSTL